MSNLYKGQINYHKGEFYTRVIDNNEIVEQKLSALSMGADSDAAPVQLDAEPGFQIDYVEQAKEEAAQIVSQAAAQAEEILKKAASEAENLKDSARKKAESKGYEEGMARAQTQADQMRGELDSLRQQHEQDYAARLERMEAELMQVVIEVFDKVLQTDFARQQEILLHLIRSTVQNIKNSSQFRLRVSGEDYPLLVQQKEEILQKIGKGASLDILMDDSIYTGHCTIDTEEGIFDCGLDTQFQNLVRDLKALSCLTEEP